MLKENTHRPPIPSDVRSKWQRIVDLAAGLYEADSVLVVLYDPPDIVVLVANDNPENPYKEGERRVLTEDMFCHDVIAGWNLSRTPDSLGDPVWETLPDTGNNLVSYIGVPLLWPDGGVFGALCVLDGKERHHSDFDLALLELVRDSIENHLGLIVYRKERNSKEKELRDSEERFRRLSDAAMEGLVILDGGSVIDANPAVLELFGYDSGEVIGMNPMDFVAQESRETVARMIAENKEEIYEFIGIRKDGTTFYVEARGRLLHYRGKDVRVTAIRDVTEHRKILEDLERSESFLRQVIDLVPHCIFARDWDGGYILANRASASFFNTTVEDMVGRNIAELHRYPDDVKDILETDRKIIMSGNAVHIPTREIYNADGALSVQDLTKIPFSASGSDMKAILGIGVDISERIRAEKALRESEEHYRFIFDNAPASLWEYNVSEVESLMEDLRNGEIGDYSAFLKENPKILDQFFAKVRLVDINRETLRVYGAPSKEALLARFGKDMIPSAAEVFIESIAAFMNGESSYECEALNRTYDGRIIDIHFRITFPGKEQRLKRALVSVIDITGRKRAEERLRESENLFRS
ncbi:MAG: PAS domain S-box protein, partial [Candidatus Latescibacteria bacterium]|nr:PAS domain S-box protein [Candidatus Latescibacterota bacterium]